MELNTTKNKLQTLQEEKDDSAKKLQQAAVGPHEPQYIRYPSVRYIASSRKNVELFVKVFALLVTTVTAAPPPHCYVSVLEAARRKVDDVTKQKDELAKKLISEQKASADLKGKLERLVAAQKADAEERDDLLAKV